MSRVIYFVTMRVHGDCRSKCPRCGVEVIAKFTPKVTPDGAASAWTVMHSEPRCADDIADQIDWASEDFDWTPVIPEGPSYTPRSRI